VAYASSVRAIIEPLLPKDLRRRHMASIVKSVAERLDARRRRRLADLLPKLAAICRKHEITMLAEGVPTRTWLDLAATLIEPAEE
jgi:ribosomal protein L18E